MTTETVVIKSGKATIVKDPDAKLDYPFDWTEWLDLINDDIKPPPDIPTFVLTEGLVLASLARNGTRGTGKNYKTDAVGYAVGATSINVAGGTGTILVGDVLRFGDDPTLYPVSNFAAGVVTLPTPGLLQAIVSIVTAVSVRAVVTPMLTGGNAGKTATCACHIQTVGGRIDDRTLYLKIKER